MPSADLYGSVETFLTGDTGDIRTAVNGEQPSLLAAGSVLLARPRAAVAQARFPQAKPISVEIHRQTPPATRVIGAGWVERDAVFLIESTVRQRDLPQGQTQQSTALAIARAIVFRYEGRSNTAVALTGLGTTAFFRRSGAQLEEINEDVESHEFARTVVRVVFTFTETQDTN